jgi:predicted O-methyltransferase YrrM
MMCRYKIGPEKGRILEAATRQAMPTTAVELGSFVGYSAIRVARNLAPGGRLVCVEGNPECVQAMEGVLSHAGVRDLVAIHQGLSSEVLPTLPLKYGPAQLLFEDHCKPCYLPDLKLAETAPTPLVAPGCWVLAGGVHCHTCHLLQSGCWTLQHSALTLCWY